MLDFYSFDEIAPFPDDIPDDSTFLGAIDLEAFDDCLRSFGSMNVPSGSVPSFFDDFVLSPDDVRHVASLGSELAETSPGVRALLEIISRSNGRNILAICD